MIDKEIQDQLWKCAPKAFREAVKNKWEDTDSGSYAESLLEDIFGEHNLISGSEPEEVLMVSRSEVQDRFNTFNNPNWASNEEEAYGAQLVIDTLDLLFGSKCLPDELEQGLEQTSVQVEESEAEPTTQTNDNMEEKELNLGEILKDYIGDTFFHPHYGDVEVEKVTSFIFLRVGDGTTLSIPKTDCLYATGMAFLYPDAESLKKYPFDGKVAWQEFVEANKPTYKIQGILQIFEDGALVDEIDLPDVDFKSLDLAQQAAEAVKKCLEDFHSKLNQQ